MFGKKKASLEQGLERLERRIGELESTLAEFRDVPDGRMEPERRSLAGTASAGERVQDALRRVELEEQTAAEIRSAMQAKLQEIDEKSRQFEREQQAAREDLQREAEEKRARLDRELEQCREESLTALQDQVDRFWKNYNSYLARIQDEMGKLTEAALCAGQAILEDKDTDIDGVFRELMDGSRPEERPSEETVPEGETAPPEGGPVPEEETAPPGEETPPPEAEDPFITREDVPAR